MFEIIMTIVFLFLDQFSKFLIVKNMNIYDSIPILKEIFHITYIHNTGIVFGMLTGHNFYILIGTVIFIVLFLFSLRKDFVKIYSENKHNIVFKLSLAMFLGGALGNILDRFFRGFVVDFLDFRVWPVFNFADSFICVSFFVFAVYFLSKEKSKLNASNIISHRNF